MHNLHGLRGLHSLHSLRSVFYHDRCNHCRVQFTHVVYWCANLEEQKKLLRKQKRSNPIPSDTNMATDYTFPITINFEQRYMDIYGKPGELYFWVEFSALKRKPLSLIFGIQNNKI